MCEKYLYGSEGGAGHDRPYPYPRHQKIVPFRKGADGVVARESRLGMRFEASACERPPRLRRFGGFATFY